MPVVPTTVERVALRANLLPGAALDVYGTAALHAAALATDLGVFDALAVPRTAEELATTLDADERGLRSLLDALTATGYLRRDGDRYRTSAGVEKWLAADGAADLGPWLRFWADVVVPYWREHAERAVREGDPGESLYEWLGDDEAGWAAAQAGFAAAASALVDPACDALGRVDGYRVLDLGGGHGAYAVELARRGADVTLVDHPAALGVACEAVAAAGVGDRVTLRGGDYLTDDLGDGHDAVLLFNVLHGHGPDECARLLSRAVAALVPGGRVAVLDQFAGDAPTRLAAVGLAVVDLTYLVTLGGRTHDAAAVEGWLADAGAAVVDSTGFRRAPGVRLLVGERAPLSV